MTTANILSQLGSPGVSTGFKNRIINGAMVIDQRNGGASITQDTSGAQYSVDRWDIYGNVAGKFTAQQNAGSVTPPVGFSYYLGITSTSAYSIGSSDVFQLQTKIEGFNTADLGWGTANAKTVTLSFWVRSSLTGTFGGALVNGAADYSYPYSYSIPAANTWTQISVTITGPTAGTWVGATNGLGIRVYFGLGVGSSASGTPGTWASTLYRSATGATSVVSTNGATLYITGVQLEVGTTATNFDYRPYTTELQLCQRYCWVQNNVNASDGYMRFSIAAVGEASTSMTTIVQFPVRMRAQPSFSPSGSFQAYNGGFYTPSGLPTFASSSGGNYTDNMCFVLPFTTGISQGVAYHVLSANNNNTKIIYSAEL